MAIATTKTLLPLDTFAQIAGIHPLHYNQVVVDGIVPSSTCQDPFLQYSWQDADKTGREEIADTINDVEDILIDRLNFTMVPTFYANHNVRYPRPTNPDIFATSIYDVRSLFRAVKLGAGYAVSGGREAKLLIEASSAVVYSDADSDTYFETATITVTIDPTVVQASEIGIYYPGNNAADEFEVRPTNVSISGTTATILCRREQLVRPEFLFGLSTRGVDGLDDANFLSEVDVYRHYLDPSQPQVEFRWEQTPWVPGTGAVQFATQNGWMLLRDQKLGWADLEPAHWDINTNMALLDFFTLVRMPDTARVWFKAGWPLDSRTGQMDKIWARAITYYVLSRLDRPLCSCDSIRTFTAYWAFDFAQNAPDHTQQIARKRLENPLGTTRAAVYLWETIMRHRLSDALSSADN